MSAISSSRCHTTGSATEIQTDQEYFTFDEISELFKFARYDLDATATATDIWSSINSFRTVVPASLNQGLTELISKCAKERLPIIEIGSGIGYTLQDPMASKIVRTQPNTDECLLLAKESGFSVHRLNIDDIYVSLKDVGKKISLFFALNVFDTLSMHVRQRSFRQLSELQNKDDRILIMLDTNPCLNNIYQNIKDTHPNDTIFPFFPIENEIEKMSFIAVPRNIIDQDIPFEEFFRIMNREHSAFLTGYVSKLQFFLNFLKGKYELKIIYPEDLFTEQVQQELRHVGYKTNAYYHTAFTTGKLPEKAPAIKQDLVYKCVTDTATVREWDLKDERLRRLMRKNIKLPQNFNEEFIEGLRSREEKIFGAEILVIEAIKI